MQEISQINNIDLLDSSTSNQLKTFNFESSNSLDESSLVLINHNGITQKCSIASLVRAVTQSVLSNNTGLPVTDKAIKNALDLKADSNSVTSQLSLKADKSSVVTPNDLQNFVLPYTLWGGRDLVTVLGVSNANEAITWLNNNKSNPTAWVEKGIRVGDYVEVSHSSFTPNTQRIAIAQCDFDGFNYSGYSPCIWMTFVNCICLMAHHNTYTNAGGYEASDIRAYLNSTTYNALQSIGLNVRTSNILYETADNSNWGWKSEKVFLPTESQVYGHGCWGNTVNTGFNANNGQPNQLDYYKLRPNNRKKYYNGSNYWWWLMNPAWQYSPDRNACFGNVDANGDANCHGADGAIGVSPLFIL